jgi:hypothetical protein
MFGGSGAQSRSSPSKTIAQDSSLENAFSQKDQNAESEEVHFLKFQKFGGNVIALPQ